MKLSDRDLILVSNWFDIAQGSLEDADLKLFDKISFYLKEDIKTPKGGDDDYLIFDLEACSKSDDEDNNEDFLETFEEF